MKKLSKVNRALQRESELNQTLQYFTKSPPSIKDKGDWNVKYQNRSYNRTVEDFIFLCDTLSIGVYEYREARDNIKRELSNLIYHLEYLSGSNNENLLDYSPNKISFKDAMNLFKQAVPYFTTDFDGQVYP